MEKAGWCAHLGDRVLSFWPYKSKAGVFCAQFFLNTSNESKIPKTYFEMKIEEDIVKKNITSRRKSGWRNFFVCPSARQASASEPQWPTGKKSASCRQATLVWRGQQTNDWMDRQIDTESGSANLSICWFPSYCSQGIMQCALLCILTLFPLLSLYFLIKVFIRS